LPNCYEFVTDNQLFLPISLSSVHSCFYWNPWRQWMAFLCWCAVKKLLTHRYGFDTGKLRGNRCNGFWP